MKVTLHPTQPPLQLLRRPLQPVAACGAPVAPKPVAGWMDRLANWAERQPPHHRMGSLDASRLR